MQTIRRTATMSWQHGLIAVLCAALAVAPAMVTTACNSAQVQSVVTDVSKFSPVVLNVLELACTFTPAAPECAVAGPVLQKLITDLQTALATYEQQLAAGTATVSAWNVLNALFDTFETQTSVIFSLFHLSGAATQSQALSIAASGETLLSVIEALFPSAPTATKAGQFAAGNTPRQSKYASALPPGGVAFFSLSGWQRDYNKKVDAAKKVNPKAKLSHVTITHGF
jgi:hypothetical protein